MHTSVHQHTTDDKHHVHCQFSSQPDTSPLAQPKSLTYELSLITHTNTSLTAHHSLIIAHHTHTHTQRYVNGTPDTWWQIDLGAERTLSPTYYTMRHDASHDYVRSWVLQGSMDGEWLGCFCVFSDGASSVS